MGTCGHRFRRAFFIKSSTFSTKSSLEYQKLFCLVALLVFERYFHLGSDTSEGLMCVFSLHDGISIENNSEDPSFLFQRFIFSLKKEKKNRNTRKTLHINRQNCFLFFILVHFVVSIESNFQEF